MHPIVYFAVAPLLLAFAIFTYFNDREHEAAKALARAHKPPSAIQIEYFDPAHNVGPANEVVVIGQVDLAHMVELTKSKHGSIRDRWNIAPIYPATAKDTSAPARGVFEQNGTLSDEQLAGMVIGRGAFGPIMKIDGIQTTEFSAKQAVSNALEERVKIAPSPLIVDPFENGRAVGLAADQSGPGVALGILVLSLAVAGYGVFIRARRRAADEAAYA